MIKIQKEFPLTSRSKFKIAIIIHEQHKEPKNINILWQETFGYKSERACNGHIRRIVTHLLDDGVLRDRIIIRELYKNRLSKDFTIDEFFNSTIRLGKEADAT